jgi:hypothetical protein
MGALWLDGDGGMGKWVMCLRVRTFGHVYGCAFAGACVGACF